MLILSFTPVIYAQKIIWIISHSATAPDNPSPLYCAYEIYLTGKIWQLPSYRVRIPSDFRKFPDDLQGECLGRYPG